MGECNNEGGEGLEVYLTGTARLPVKVEFDRETARHLTQIVYLAKTIFGEARGEGKEGMRLVAWVIRNRVRSALWPDTYADVVTQRKQFSAWLETDPNYNRMADPLAGNEREDEAWYDAVIVASEVIFADESQNPLPNVYHYVDVRLKDKIAKGQISWAKGKKVITRPEAPRIIFLEG